MIKNRRSLIVGLKSTILRVKEKQFLRKYKPWGVILFSRNIQSIVQTKKLTDDIRKIFNDKKYPILIDQEGGRVNRLSNLIDSSNFTGEFFGKLYKKNIKKFNVYYRIFINQTCYLLDKIGININTVPVLDVRHKKSNNIRTKSNTVKQEFFSFKTTIDPILIYNTFSEIVTEYFSNPTISLSISTKDENFSSLTIDEFKSLLSDNQKALSLLSLSASEDSLMFMITFQFNNDIVGPNGNYTIMPKSSRGGTVHFIQPTEFS